MLKLDHNRKNMAKLYIKNNADSILYDDLFKKVKTLADDFPHSGNTDDARSKFLERHGNLVFISGQPGIGKTTLTKRMLSRMWEENLFEPNIVFFIRFRNIDFTIETDLLQFLAPEFQSIKEIKDRFSIIQKLEDTENVFILMDGLDEANIKMNSFRSFTLCNISCGKYTAERFLPNLLAGNILSKSKKLVTSRPHRITQLQKTEFNPKFLFTIQGLDEEGRQQICSDICDKDKKIEKKIRAFLREHPVLESHCQTPVICIMIVRGLKQKLDAAKNADMSSVEQSYRTITAIFVDALEKWLLSKLKDLDNDHRFPIKNISEFAFKKYNEDKWYFPSHEINDQIIKEQHRSVFFNTFLAGKNEMYFIHLMWQEFLAAIKLRLYTKKEDYDNKSNSESFLSKLSNKKFEAVTTKFLFGLCNTGTLEALLRIITPEKDCNDPNKFLKCEDMLKDFVIKKLNHLRNAEYFSDSDDSNSYDDSSSDDEDKVDCDESNDSNDSNESDISRSSSEVMDSTVEIDAGGKLRRDSNSNNREIVDDSHDDDDIDLDETSYFASVLPILGWVHEMDNNDFTIEAAKCLRQKFCIEHYILSSDIPIIMHVLSARNEKMDLKVVNSRFLGNCLKYFLEELLKVLTDKKNIQVSHQNVLCIF